MDVIILQSPFSQLNSPYPASAYLFSFFNQLKKNKDMNIDSVQAFDVNNDIFHAIFSAQGLNTIFNEVEKNEKTLLASLEEESLFNVVRFLSFKDRWTRWIEPIKAILCTNQKEHTHEFIHSAHVPRGFRMEQYLHNLHRKPSVEDSAILASLAIADLSDFIRIAFDESFSLVHYASSLAESQNDFSIIEKCLDSPILIHFLTPVLDKIFANISKEKEILFCLSTPFAGTVVGAFFMARFIKKYFPHAHCSLGGGFVNTELREVQCTDIFTYIDFISYDAGFGSYCQLFDFLKSKKQGEKLYKLKYFFNSQIIDMTPSNDEKNSLYNAKEKSFLKNILPDYSFCDFATYPKMVDDINPMHRIWSDGTWIKAYLAYGCYWHRCTFCDTQLDYVHNFCMQNEDRLFEDLYQQAQKQKSFGVHFVDEAAPPVMLKNFALKNCRLPAEKNPLTFWGNVRFEKVFSSDLAHFLAFGGLTAVSAGIEIAVEDEISNIDKGTTLADIVASCAAFKEAGILVHAYMIFGYFYETPQILINSMEILRQFFVIGLIDSCFWHKFVLTKHSKIFAEWKKGLHPQLQPQIKSNKKIFADYDVPFINEKNSQKYEAALLQSLHAWMQGKKLNQNVQKWFNFAMPSPTIEKNYVQTLVNQYEQRKKKTQGQRPAQNKCYYWLGSNPIIINDVLHWFFMDELQSLPLPTMRASPSATAILHILTQLSPSFSQENKYSEKIYNTLHLLPKDKLNFLRKNGLVVV
ncbi:MAG: radical SAM protein [Treponemataceae bacterium]